MLFCLTTCLPTVTHSAHAGSATSHRPQPTSSRHPADIQPTLQTRDRCCCRDRGDRLEVMVYYSPAAVLSPHRCVSSVISALILTRPRGSDRLCCFFFFFFLLSKSSHETLRVELLQVETRTLAASTEKFEDAGERHRALRVTAGTDLLLPATDNSAPCRPPVHSARTGRGRFLTDVHVIMSGAHILSANNPT